MKLIETAFAFAGFAITITVAAAIIILLVPCGLCVLAITAATNTLDGGRS